MRKVSKATAIALLKRVGLTMFDLEWCRILTLETGCKLYMRKRGCVAYFTVAGYAADGSDVAKALEMVGA